MFGEPNFAPIPLAVSCCRRYPTRTPDWIGGSAKALGYTWHLSVVNAGQPRSVQRSDAVYRLTAAPIDCRGVAATCRSTPATGRSAGSRAATSRSCAKKMFGTPEGMPVTGDFNGDGVCGRRHLPRRPVVSRPQRQRPLGRGRPVGQARHARTICPSPATGTTTARPTSASTARRGPAIRGRFEHEPGLPDADNYPDAIRSARRRTCRRRPTKPPAAAALLKRTAQGKPRADLIDHVFHYGTPGDVPITGDWNGDGIRAIGVFRDGEWTLDLDGDGRFTETDGRYTFGQAGDLPVIGDFNGDGVDEIGVYRDGQWIIDTNGNRQIDAHDTVFELGERGRHAGRRRLERRRHRRPRHVPC